MISCKKIPLIFANYVLWLDKKNNFWHTERKQKELVCVRKLLRP